MKVLRSLTLAMAIGAGMMPLTSQAWWSGDYKHRTKVTLNTTAQGVETKEALSGAVVPVRLHSGNFDFLGAKPDGSDIRVVAADDKSPLKFWVERFDSTNELAVLWVQVPSIAPGTDKNHVFVYAGNEKAAAEANQAAIFDGAMLAAITMSGKDAEAVDASGQIKSNAAISREANGLIGAAAKLDGQQGITWSSDKLKASASGPYSVSLWVKPEAAAGQLIKQGPLAMGLDAGKLATSLGSLKAVGGDLPVNAWAHVAITVGAGKLTLYVNGAQAAQADLAGNPAAIEGPLVVGEGFKGLVDELEVAATVRSADWVKLASAAQSADAKLVATVTQTGESAEAEEGGPESEFAVLIKNLTPDAWAVIIILAIMFIVAAYVMVTKAILVGRADRDNQAFLKRFREAHNVLTVDGSTTSYSTLARLYAAGLRELNKRDVGKPDLF